MCIRDRGYAKTGGNYAASLKAQDEAEEQKYTQVLWLDGVERKYVEEVGTMNVFFVIGDEVVTPALQEMCIRDRHLFKTEHAMW